jgi:YD repeat-containing protein
MAGSRMLVAGYVGSRLETISHTNGQAISLDYNSDSRIQYLTDHAGRVTEYIYEPGGELLERVIAPGGVTTDYGYRPSAGGAGDYALVSETHPDGTHTYFDHDAWGRMSTRWLNGGAERLDYSYDKFGTVTGRFGSNGELFEMTNHLLEKVRLRYDTSLNLTRLILPDNTRYRLDYDTLGNPIQVTTPRGSLLRLSFTNDPTRLDWFIDAREHLMDFRYENGNPTRIDHPDGSSDELTYDPADGDVETFTNRRLDTLSLVHNDLGELTDVVWPDGTWFEYSHDEAERRWTFTDAAGTTSIDFDGRSFLEYVDGPTGHWNRYTYNDAGRRQQLTTDDGFVSTTTTTTPGVWST